MTKSTRVNRPRLQIKDMDEEEKKEYIKDPLKMLGVLMFCAIVISVGFYIKEGLSYGICVAPAAFTFLIILFVTDWWESFDNWRNWGTRKRNHPEEWKQREEEREKMIKEAKEREKEKVYP